MEAGKYFKKWSENCRIFQNYHPIHSHEDMLKFAEDYHQSRIKAIDAHFITSSNAQTPEERGIFEHGIERVRELLLIVK